MKKKIHLLPSLGLHVFPVFAFLLSISACDPDDSIPAIPAGNINCDEITSNEVWANRNDSIDYIVDCILTINAKLTIEPGVKIQFNTGAGIIIANSGALNAVGTLENPIVMKGIADSTGIWKGLFFISNSPANELKYCTVTNGGSESFDGHADYVANIRVALDAALKISNTEVSKSGQDGLFTEGFDDSYVTPITFFANNLFAGCVGYPISTTAATINNLDGLGSTYPTPPGGHNYINIRGGRMYGNHIWKVSFPFLVTGNILVGYYGNEGNLNVEPGVYMRFAGDYGLATGEYSTGYISIIGTGGIYLTVFTGDTVMPGAWKGICFNSTNVNNRISGVHINSGGSSSFTGNPTHLANISIGGFSAGYATIENTVIEGSAGYGIFVSHGSTEPAVTNPHYGANVLGNYYVEP